MIIAVADSYDAMTTDRPYRKALSKEEAISEIRAHSGKQFCPEIVEAFIKLINDENKTSKSAVKSSSVSDSKSSDQGNQTFKIPPP